MRLVHGALAFAVGGWNRLPRGLRLLGPIAVMMVLWWSSSKTPDHSAPSALKAWLHNSAHVIAYGGLAGAWLVAFVSRIDGELRLAARHSVVALLLSIAYGVVDEVHQSYVPERDSSVVDVISDSIGSGIALVLVSWALRRDARLPIALPWLLLAAVGSVSLATFGRW